MLHILQREGKWILLLIWLNFIVLSSWPNLPAGVAARSLLGYLSISGVLELKIKRGQILRKANTLGYNFYRRPFSNFIIIRPESSRKSRQRIYQVFHQWIKCISNYHYSLFLVWVANPITVCMATLLNMTSQGHLR